VRGDDIVRELRDASAIARHPWDQALFADAADEIEQLRIAYRQAMNTLEQAAGEIERLRAVGDALAAALIDIADLHADEYALIDTWKQARRG